jgi:hypothetical protein
MVATLIGLYLIGWLLVTFAVYAAGMRLTDRQVPAEHPLIVSLAAGAVWPLLLVGVVELSTVVLFAWCRPRPDTASASSRSPDFWREDAKSHDFVSKRATLCLVSVVGVAGFEPTTSSSRTTLPERL